MKYMNSQEIADFKKQKEITFEKVVKAVVENMENEKEGRLTTYGVIRTLESIIKSLESRALRSNPLDYLDNPES